MNFARDVVDAAPATAEALITIGRSGERRSWSFGEIADRTARLASSVRTTPSAASGKLRRAALRDPLA